VPEAKQNVVLDGYALTTACRAVGGLTFTPEHVVGLGEGNGLGLGLSAGLGLGDWLGLSAGLGLGE
jgi:hypothetical protein